MVSIKQLASGSIECDVVEEEGDFPNIDIVDNENQLVVVECCKQIYHFYWYTKVCPFCHGSLQTGNIIFSLIYKFIKLECC